MHLLTKLSPKHEDFELRIIAVVKLGLLTQRPQNRNFLRQKVKRFFSRPEKRELKEGKQMENVAVFTSF